MCLASFRADLKIILHPPGHNTVIASQDRLMSAGGRRGRHQRRKVRRVLLYYTMKSTGDSESPCGVPTVVLGGADSASSTLMVMFVSGS